MDRSGRDPRTGGRAHQPTRTQLISRPATDFATELQWIGAEALLEQADELTNLLGLS